MSAAKASSNKKNSHGWLPTLLGFVLRPRVVVPLAVAALIGGGAYTAWKAVEPHVLDSPQYHLDPQQIVITRLPDWISKTDVLADVLRDAGLDASVSLLDPELAERVSKAFRLHPWVADVTSVRKVMPAGLQVDLVYRRPVCMVEVPGGLYAVDETGVLLPTGDFTPMTARRFPRLSGSQLVTAGPVGSRWQDARVQGAAQIAAVLFDVWDELYLNRIVPSVEQGQPLPGDSNEFDIFTTGLTRIRWGRPPNAPSEGEATPQEKLAALQTYAKLNDGLDGTKGPQDLDVRQGRVIATPRVAVSPTPESETPK